MSILTATAVAHPNIAFIKYWGNRNHELRLPSNGSISMTLGKLETQTTVSFDTNLDLDEVTINDSRISGIGLSRVSKHLNVIRKLASLEHKAKVISDSNFPIGTGIASSASGFAALTLAASAAAQLDLSQKELSRISRLGSGSACRSIFGGYVEWETGETDLESFAQPLASIEHWNLIDLVAITDNEHKETGSTSGHRLADSSPLQLARVQDTGRRLQLCKDALMEKDFQSLASIAEEDSNMMHAVMMTSSPSLLYWRPPTLKIMQSVVDWRRDGLEVFYTIDAGPNVHCICSEDDAPEIKDYLLDFDGVIDVIQGNTGDDARLILSGEPSI
jgi:diphosphomevalonate decarboxylase